MDLKSLFWQETVQVCCALKTFTGFSHVLIMSYFYYFHHVLMYKAYGCGTVQVWLSSSSLNFSHASIQRYRKTDVLWLSSPCPVRLLVVPSKGSSMLTTQGAGLTEQNHSFTLLNTYSQCNYPATTHTSPWCPMLRAEAMPFSWAGGGSSVEHVPVVIVAVMFCCGDQRSVFVSHLGEKVELWCRDLPWLLLIDLPRLLHLLCASGHPFSLVTYLIMIAAGFAALCHYGFLREHFSVRQVISFYMSGNNDLVSSVFQ